MVKVCTCRTVLVQASQREIFLFTFFCSSFQPETTKPRCSLSVTTETRLISIESQPKKIVVFVVVVIGVVVDVVVDDVVIVVIPVVDPRNIPSKFG